jgi:sulfate adenylyltransferase subunit 1
MEQGLIRVSTAGSVDDGKSTLLGRLLFDAKSIFDDQLSSLALTTARRGGVGGNQQISMAHDLALLTDGLMAEREQGITIDVAYRYFSTPSRKFILADTPGHEQYTRNMVTGASTASLTIVLLDASKGVLPQSKRHAAIAALLGIQHVVVAVNKMDLVGYSQQRFDALAEEFKALAHNMGLREVRCIPVSALLGDMVVERGEAMPWYQGPTLLEVLEQTPLDDGLSKNLRFPVQLVSRPGDNASYVRGYMGRIESGSVAVGDQLLVEPSGRSATVARIFDGQNFIDKARAPSSVTIVLEEDVDVSRGDMLTHKSDSTSGSKSFSAMVCWMDEEPLDLRRPYLIKHTTRQSRAMIGAVDYRLDITSLRSAKAETLAMNDIGRITFKTRDALSADPYETNRSSGAFILIDEASNRTVAAGMLGASSLDSTHG